jgi:hypothetical protein
MKYQDIVDFQRIWTLIGSVFGAAQAEAAKPNALMMVMAVSRLIKSSTHQYASMLCHAD